LAKELKIKHGPLLECMNSGKHENAVMADFNEARNFGIEGTPAFLINGILFTGAQRIEAFRNVIDRELGVDVIP
jgi:protein-disulfide isomerase